MLFFVWPIVTVVLFKRLSSAAAVSSAIIGGYLLLPPGAGLNLPFVPALTKEVLPALIAFIIVFSKRERRPFDDATIQSRVEHSRSFNLLIALMLLSPIATVLNNAEPVVAGPRVIEGVSIYDAVSSFAATLLVLLPFFLGRKLLGTDEGHRTFLKILAILALGYSILALYEIRMSPQLNRMFYGYFPHSFLQHIRGGGYRPLVFLNHGLLLGLFLAMAAVASLAAWRSGLGQERRIVWIWAGLYLAAVLVLSKSLGALLLFLAIFPIVLMAGVRGQLLAAAAMGLVVLFYPMLRGADVVPTEQVVAFAEQIDTDRAASLNFRLEQEAALLERANIKPLFGWGGWGRSRIFNEATGRDESVTDGLWVITIGTSGWVGYIAKFGLLILPVVLLAYNRQRYGLTLATSGLALILAINLFDLLPNAGLTPVTWLIAGALAGRIGQKHETQIPSDEVGARSESRAQPLHVRRTRN